VVGFFGVPFHPAKNPARALEPVKPAAVVVVVLGEAGNRQLQSPRRGKQQAAAMMSFKGHEGFGGQVSAATGAGSQVAASHGAAAAGAGPLPWWAGPQLLFGEPAPLSPEETRRDSQFQVVPGAQGTPPDPAPPKRGTPEVLKFSVFQGDFFFVCLFLYLLLLLVKFMDYYSTN